MQLFFGKYSFISLIYANCIHDAESILIILQVPYNTILFRTAPNLINHTLMHNYTRNNKNFIQK